MIHIFDMITLVYEKFVQTKGVINSRNSTNDRQ